MCGRFTLTTPGAVLAEAFGLDEAPAAAARFNVAPTQPVLTVRREAGRPRGLAVLRWGLLPPTERPPDRPLINARAETVARLPSVREAFRRRRCLIPADGFFEWKAIPGRRRKQPVYLRLRDSRPFAFAGLWEPGSGKGPGEVEGSCTIVTTEPNALLAEIHDRMPVILPPQAYDLWLDPSARESVLASLLRPFPAESMVASPVGLAVNDARVDGPECIRPLLL